MAIVTNAVRQVRCREQFSVNGIGFLPAAANIDLHTIAQSRDDSKTWGTSGHAFGSVASPQPSSSFEPARSNRAREPKGVELSEIGQLKTRFRRKQRLAKTLVARAGAHDWIDDGLDPERLGELRDLNEAVASRRIELPSSRQKFAKA